MGQWTIGNWKLSRGGGFEQVQEFQLFFSRQKRCLEGVAGEFAEVLVGESEGLLGKLVFAGECCAEHGGVVAVERDHDAVVEITFRWMFVKVGTETGAEVAGEADFDRDLALGKLFDEIGVVEGGEAVADALGAQVERSPYGFRRTSFSGVCGEPHAVVGGPSVGVAEKFWWSFLLVAADSDADDFAIVITHGKFEDFLRSLGSELTDSVEDPNEGDAEVTRATGASAIESLEDRGEILVAPEAYSNRDAHLGVQNVFFFQALHQAVGNQFVIFRRAQVLRNVFEGEQKAGKIGVGIESLYFSLCDPFAATGAEFEQRGRLDCALEVEMELGLG